MTNSTRRVYVVEGGDHFLKFSDGTAIFQFSTDQHKAVHRLSGCVYLQMQDDPCSYGQHSPTTVDIHVEDLWTTFSGGYSGRVSLPALRAAIVENYIPWARDQRELRREASVKELTTLMESARMWANCDDNDKEAVWQAYDGNYVKILERSREFANTSLLDKTIELVIPAILSPRKVGGTGDWSLFAARLKTLIEEVQQADATTKPGPPAATKAVDQFSQHMNRAADVLFKIADNAAIPMSDDDVAFHDARVGVLCETLKGARSMLEDLSLSARDLEEFRTSIDKVADKSSTTKVHELHKWQEMREEVYRIRDEVSHVLSRSTDATQAFAAELLAVAKVLRYVHSNLQCHTLDGDECHDTRVASVTNGLRRLVELSDGVPGEFELKANVLRELYKAEGFAAAGADKGLASPSAVEQWEKAGVCVTRAQEFLGVCLDSQHAENEKPASANPFQKKQMKREVFDKLTAMRHAAQVVLINLGKERTNENDEFHVATERKIRSEVPSLLDTIQSLNISESTKTQVTTDLELVLRFVKESSGEMPSEAEIKLWHGIRGSLKAAAYALSY